MTASGRCLCGAITYELTGDPIATAICHCEHCQRQGGSAFSVNLIVHESQMSVTGTLSTFEDRGDDGGDTVHVYRRFCGACGSPIMSELVQPAGILAVKAGTLDDRSAVAPTVEAWCDHKQPWVQIPGLATSLARE
ncbi:GFA family protein [Desertimonas flava]|uniref:GFA family protein n=1 Tax=Desertimonas flava TaxID=2064846 RepID=UPI000E35581A|nr:GFA family protein [Desertimonas flava]